jgi:glutamine cyclotransferase
MTHVLDMTIRFLAIVTLSFLLSGNAEAHVDASGHPVQAGQAPQPDVSQPSTAEPLPLLFECESPFEGNHGLAWDGTYLWLVNWGLKTANRLDPSTCQVVHSIPLPGTYPTGLAWDGTHLWAADGNSEKIYRLDPSSGAIEVELDSPGSFPNGLGFGGADLIASDSASNINSDPDELHRISVTGTLLLREPSPGEHPSGVTFDGEYVWHSDNIRDEIYKLDASDFSVIETYQAPGTYPNGLAWDGWNLWVVDNGTDRIYQYQVLQQPMPAIPTLGTTGLLILATLLAAAGLLLLRVRE